MRITPALTVISLIFISACVVVAHELAHIASSLLLGLPASKFVLFDSTTLSPTIYWADIVPSARLTAVYWAGGIGGATIAIVIYLPIKILQHNSTPWRVAAAVAGGLIFWQISQSILEGAFHNAYIGGSGGRSIATLWAQIGPLFAGMLLVPIGRGWAPWRHSILAGYFHTAKQPRCANAESSN